MTVVFDKLAAVRRLEQAEFSRPQAEAMTDVFHDAVHSAVATKADLGEARAELKAELADTRAELKAELAETRAELKAELAETRAELKADIAAVRTELKLDVAAVRTEVVGLRSEMREQRSELKLWMAGAVVAAVGALGTLMTFLLRARGIG